jgi:hypothetical protein
METYVASSAVLTIGIAIMIGLPALTVLFCRFWLPTRRNRGGPRPRRIRRNRYPALQLRQAVAIPVCRARIVE